MAYVPTELKYTKEHEWVLPTGDGLVRIGITEYAQKQLGDIVFVELPAENCAITAGEPFGTIESVKSVSEVYAPVSGQVTALNEELNDSPENVNLDPYGDGWLIELKITDKSELSGLLSSKGYEDYIREGDD
ncbi:MULTISPECIES: glycine cleavage system protein GcvH [Streptomyces]|uniref:glycine cleavage system protein GcvH n=1 Tax=Streptomyces TaxID=1883 RepID=UPI002930E694|nr:glycine cleavage system protein GcvH [Streptomyces sp. NEAU-HV9]